MNNNKDAQREAFRLKNEKRKASRDHEAREADRFKGELLALGLYNHYRFEAQLKAKKKAQEEKKAREEARRGRPGRAPYKPHRR